MKESLSDRKIKPQSIEEADKSINRVRITVGIRHEIVTGGGLIFDSQMASVAVVYQSDEELHRAIRARGRIRLQKPC